MHTKQQGKELQTTSMSFPFNNLIYIKKIAEQVSVSGLVYKITER